MSKPRHSADPQLITYQTLRRIVGYLALLLPVVTMTGYILFGIQRFTILDSISEYYYSIMRDYFVGTLCMVGLFLIAYKGYDDVEDWVFNLAAVFCWAIAFFSMDPKCNCGSAPVDGQFAYCAKDIWLPDHCFTAHYFTLLFYNKVMLLHRNYFSLIHFGSATALFFILGLTSFYFFTKKEKDRDPDADEPTPEKQRRNKIYKALGIIIWVAIGLYGISIALEALFPHSCFLLWLADSSYLFFTEWICLWAFGISWLIKGEGIGWLNDKPRDPSAHAPAHEKGAEG